MFLLEILFFLSLINSALKSGLLFGRFGRTLMYSSMASMASTEILGIEQLIHVYACLVIFILVGFIVGIRRNRDVL